MIALTEARNDDDEAQAEDKNSTNHTNSPFQFIVYVGRRYTVADAPTITRICIRICSEDYHAIPSGSTSSVEEVFQHTG